MRKEKRSKGPLFGMVCFLVMAIFSLVTIGVSRAEVKNDFPDIPDIQICCDLIDSDMHRTFISPSIIRDNVGTITPDTLLTTKNKIHAEEIIFAFNDDYNLSLGQSIKKNKNLSDIYSAKDMRNGVIIGKSQGIFMQNKRSKHRVYI